MLGAFTKSTTSAKIGRRKEVPISRTSSHLIAIVLMEVGRLFEFHIVLEKHETFFENLGEYIKE